MPDIGDALINNQPEDLAGAYKPDEVSQGEEKSYLRAIKKRNKYLLVEGLTDDEKQRIANYIIDECYGKAKGKHQEICEKIDEWDEVSRLVRKDIIGSQGELPNYRLPLSLVAHEVIHANIMNVFFSPKDLMRCIPTAADDIPKVNNVSVFGNWSIKNELDIFNKCDQLFHATEKNGESVAMIYWKKEYGIEIKRVPIYDEQGNLVYDEDTQDPVYREVEEVKLLYNAPFLEVLPRKNYIQPEDAVMGQKPPWEGRLLPISYDNFIRDELQGKYYEGSAESLKGWGQKTETANQKQDYDGDNYSIPEWHQEFIEWYGGMRINIVQAPQGMTEEEKVEAFELEDEFISVVNIKNKKLCSLRKNRFPMKERPFINDYLVPDDGGRRAGIGIYELMDSLQKAYDTLYNQFVYSVELSNNPIVFFTPTGNMRDEKFKIQKGFAYPTSDANSVKIFQFPGPNDSLKFAMELVQQWAQFLFGISDYAAGMESTIDPSAPAKKAQIIVEQGNVRLNMIIKRKNDTLKEIFRKWFLLYRDNMPANKFMRIAGEDNEKDPWKFQAITFEDFALNSLPDFELTGNVLNANKQLETQKSIAIYQLLLTNVFFNPQTQQGLQALRSLTKWLIEKLDDNGLSRFLPEVQNDGILYTAEEENAAMLQGQDIQPLPDEDHIDHLKKHMAFINNQNTPEEIKPKVGEHIKATIELIKMGMARQMVQQGVGGQPMQPPQLGQPQEQVNGQTAGFGASGAPQPVL